MMMMMRPPVTLMMQRSKAATKRRWLKTITMMSEHITYRTEIKIEIHSLIKLIIRYKLCKILLSNL